MWPLLSGQVRIVPAKAHSGVSSRGVEFHRVREGIPRVGSHFVSARAGGSSVSSPCFHRL